MPRPKGGYLNKAGGRVPANGTIREQWGANKRPLMFWANRMGLEGKTLKEAEEKETTVGSIIHAIVEAELRKQPWPVFEVSLEDMARIDNALLGFYEWRDSSQLEVTHTEIELVSEEYQYGTTPDYPSKVRGRRRLIQLKTADGIYPDFFVQMAAEGQAWNENFPEDPIDGYDLLLIGKGDGSFTHMFLPRGAPKMVAGWEVFRHLRALYDLAKAMK